MRIAILQPGYLPWSGFFEQMHRSNIFVIYDDVQYDKGSWRNRNRIKTPTGWIWVTVPVIQKGRSSQKIIDTKIDNSLRWQDKHWKSLETNYRKAYFFKQYEAFFKYIYESYWENLVDLDIAIIKYLAKVLCIKTEIKRSSQLGSQGKGTIRLVNICKELGATYYLTGMAAKNYLDEDIFKKENIIIEYQNYTHPIYKQLYGDFIPYLSVIDMLFNHGDESLSILINENL